MHENDINTDCKKRNYKHFRILMDTTTSTTTTTKMIIIIYNFY